MVQAMTDPDFERAQKAYEDIRAAFFPRWDRRRSWKLEIDPSLPRNGDCGTWKPKTITLQFVLADAEELDQLLIHEICHAPGPEHGSPWQRRMMAAATKAEALGRSQLSARLKEEVDGLRDPRSKGEASAKYVYSTIEDAVMELPGLSSDEILARVAQSRGLSLAELKMRYKRSEKVCLKAIQEEALYRRKA